MAYDDRQQYTAKWWLEQIAAREKDLDKDWRLGADKIVQKFLDRRKTETDHIYKYNVFWANTGILKAALYAKPPRPLVSRLWEDPNDHVGRVGARIIQRILEHDLQRDHSDIDESFRLAIDDHLIPGLGQVWHHYEAMIVPVQIPAVVDPSTGIELAPAVYAEKVEDESVVTEYLHWRDFIWAPCRVWAECSWVARRTYTSKANFKKRFGDRMYNALKNKFESSSTSEDEATKAFIKDRIATFEIWCKDTKKLYFVTPGFDRMLDEKPDPLKLVNFFPCPEPLLSTHTTNSLVPRPDYVMVQDQYEELNELNTRIYLLEKALRVIGVYDKTNAELKRMLDESRENQMIPVENWGNLSEKGGLKGVVDWFPLETIANVLTELRQQKLDRLQEIYELTGISDIMRGVSEARETAAAQKLKAQYSSVRLQYRQADTARFAEESLRIRAQIIGGLFQPETIMKKSQIALTEDAQLAPQAIELLKNAGLSQYRIRVAEESLAMPDYLDERENRVEYLTAVGQFVSQMMPLVESKPEAAPYMIKLIQWVSSGFRGAQQMEGILDQAFTAMVQAAAQPQEPPPPDPRIVSAQIAAGTKRLEKAADIQIAKIKERGQDRRTGAEIVSDEKVAALDATNEQVVEVIKQDGAAQLAAMEAKLQMMNDIIIQLMIGQQAKEEIVIDGSIKSAQNTENNQVATLQAMLKEMLKPRVKRVSKRSADGDAEEVVEETLGADETIGKTPEELIKQVLDVVKKPRRKRVTKRGPDGEAEEVIEELVR